LGESAVDSIGLAAIGVAAHNQAARLLHQVLCAISASSVAAPSVELLSCTT
jgi:hypothetical protein